MWRWSNNFIITRVIKSYLDQSITLLDKSLQNKISFMGVDADISTYDAPVIAPTYLDLDLNVKFTQTKPKLFLQKQSTFPNKDKLNDVPNPSEAIVILNY